MNITALKNFFARETKDDILYQQFENETLVLGHEMIRITCFIGMFFYTLFGILDLFVFPNKYLEIFIWRAIFVGICIVVYFLRNMKFVQKNVQNVGMLIMTASGVDLATMCHITGGPSSIYYAGINLNFIVMMFILPLDVKRVLIASLIIYLYYMFPFFSETWKNFNVVISNNFFLITTMFLSILGTYFKNRLRLNQLEARLKLERAYRDLETLTESLSASNKSLEEAKEELTEANEYISKYNRELFEELEQKNVRLIEINELKDEFLAKTSHELRTPLAGMVGIAESSAATASAGTIDAVRSNFRLILSSGRRLMSLVNDILDFIRLKHKDIQLHKRRVDLSQLADLVFEFSTPLIQGKRLMLKNLVHPGAVVLHADENRVQQILFNLVGNAIKFCEQGEITISANALDEAPLVQITVSDTGPGIPAERLGSVFEEYEQGHADSATRYGGVGLGLSITKHLVELHGGTIKVESALGKGTDFIFTLPAFQDGEADAGIPRPGMINTETYEKVVRGRDSIPDLIGNRGRILVVDDEPMNLLVARSMLEGTGYSAVFINDATAAVGIIMKGEFDLAILDVMMPGMSGYEVCRAIRERRSLHELPVVLLTVKSDTTDIIAGFEAGANDYLVKPVRKEEFLARVDTLVRLTKTARSHKELEYKLLQEKMNPHFLFNTLNIIYSHIVRGSNVADKLVLKLAEIYRFILNQSYQPLIPFSEEWQFVKDYLEIQTYLFPDALTLRLDLQGDFSDVSIPPLTIQPMVENCIKHGFCNMRDNAYIEVHAQRSNGEVQLEVCDNGEGLGVGKVAYSSLENIKRRLLLNFNEVELNVGNRAEGGARALLSFSVAS